MNKLRLVTIIESKLYKKDKDFEIEYRKEKNLVGKKLSEDDRDTIELYKDDYYLYDFWNGTETLKDNIKGIEINFYYDKYNNEIIINDYHDSLDFDYNDYMDIFKIKFTKEKQNTVKEVDYIEFDRGDWNAKALNSDKANYIIKYRGGSGYTYSFYEYDLI